MYVFGSLTAGHISRAEKPNRLCLVYPPIMLILTLLSVTVGCESRNKLVRVIEERDQLQTRVQELSRKAEGLERDLQVSANQSESAKRINELRVESDHLRDEIHAKGGTITQMSGELSSLRQELETSKATAELAVQQAKALSNENSRLKELMGELDNPLSRLAITEWKFAKALQGASVVAQNREHTFLGVLDFLGTDPDSIFNKVGLHGSEVGFESIWNDVGFYGSTVGLYSARNNVCLNPPMIVLNRKVIGYITTNEVYLESPKFNPYYLRGLATRVSDATK